jgi:HEAT repeat protein
MPGATVSPHDRAVLENLAIDLGLLYRKHHDARSLGSLLDADLVRYQSEVLEALWHTHAPAILAVAAGLPRRLHSVAAMLEYANANPVDRREALNTLHAFTRHPDPRVRSAAARVLAMITALAQTSAGLRSTG